MKQSDLDRAVARATGESIRHIAQLGFTLLRGSGRRPKRQRRTAWSRPVAARAGISCRHSA